MSLPGPKLSYILLVVSLCLLKLHSGRVDDLLKCVCHRRPSTQENSTIPQTWVMSQLPSNLPCTLLVGLEISVATIETSMEVSQKKKKLETELPHDPVIPLLGIF